MFVCNNYQNLKEMLEVAESKKIKKEEEDQRIRTFWFKRLSSFVYYSYYVLILQRERKAYYIHASGLMSQPVPCKKRNDSHPSCMTGIADFS